MSVNFTPEQIREQSERFANEYSSYNPGIRPCHMGSSDIPEDVIKRNITPEAFDALREKYPAYQLTFFHTRDIMKATALNYAIETRNLPLIKHIVKIGGPAVLENDPNPLAIAKKALYPEAIEVLLDAGIDPAAADYSKWHINFVEEDMGPLAGSCPFLGKCMSVQEIIDSDPENFSERLKKEQVLFDGILASRAQRRQVFANTLEETIKPAASTNMPAALCRLTASYLV